MPIDQTTVSPIQKRFEKKLEEDLSKRDKEDKRYPLSPSQILNCQRKISYQLLNHESPGSIPFESFGLRKLLVFANGHRTEEIMFEELSKTPNLEVIKDKKRFLIFKLGDQEITGELDRWVKDTERNIIFIADCKAINTQAFKRLVEGCIPKDNHYYQVQMYLSSKTAQEYGATHGLIYYVNKDTQDFILLEFPFDPEAAKYGIMRLASLYQARGSILPRDFVFGRDWQCGQIYCEYHEECYKTFNTPSKTEIMDECPALDLYLTSRREADKFDVITTLLKYGDHTEYVYKSQIFVLEKLKTTLSVGLKKA